ncbi:MAG: site-2 protease family protein [Anaerolineae bacterium]
MENTLALPAPELELNTLSFSLLDELRDVFAVERATTQDRKNPAVVYYGRLLTDADSALQRLEPRLAAYGFTPMLQRKGQQDLLIAVPGVAGQSKTRLWLHFLLAAATLFTTTLAGALLAGVNPLRDFAGIWVGLPFALTLMTILTAHELGHYFMGKWHGVQVSLPYFIPAPFSLGTLGAFIQMRSPIRNRRELFDVGFAGPVVGFVVALALMILGLLFNDQLRIFRTFGPPLGNSLLTSFLTNLLRPDEAQTIISRNPLVLASYFGFLLTGINLLPAGQLDGGHIAYALFGRAARPLAFLVVISLVVLGMVAWSGWYLWAGLLLLMGLRHPGPLNDITPVDRGRWGIAVGAFVIFLLTFIPQPLPAF